MRLNKLAKKIFAAGLAVSLMMANAGVSFGADYPADKQAKGTNTKFNKYLIMDAGDSVPNVTFSFTVEAGTAIPAADGKMAVLAGVGSPTIADVTFAPGDATATEAGTNIDVARKAEDRKQGDTVATGVELESGEKFATKQATIDFSSVTFTEPGIYRYIITETASDDHAAAGIMHDTDNDRVLDVYVTDNGQGSLVVSQYVMHTDVGDVTAGADMGSGDVAEDGVALDDKTDGFTNEINTKDLKIQKEVSGNQASRDKYFEFTATVTGINDTDSFTVSIANDSDDTTNDGNADATSGTNAATIAANQSKANPTTVTGAQLKAGQKFYLQHGQSVVIRGLAPNAHYIVTENAEDYKSEVMSGKTNDGDIGTVAGNNKMAEAGFTNTRQGTIPTGVILDSAPFILIIGLAAAALIITAARKKVR